MDPVLQSGYKPTEVDETSGGLACLKLAEF